MIANPGQNASASAPSESGPSDQMPQNLLWATGYNIFAIPLAAGVAYPWGIVISPAIGAALMSLSTIIVAINAQLLARADKLVATTGATVSA